MTLIELLVFIANVTFISGIAKLRYDRGGVPGGLTGFVVGFAAVFVFWFLLGRIASATHQSRNGNDDNGG